MSKHIHIIGRGLFRCDILNKSQLGGKIGYGMFTQVLTDTKFIGYSQYSCSLGKFVIVADICSLTLLQRHDVEIQVSTIYRRTLF